MDIYVNDAFCDVKTKDKRVVGIINRVCSARPEGFQFMPRYKKGHWDGYISLANMLQFPTGLLKRVYKALKSNGYIVKVYRNNHQLKHYEVTSDLLNGIVLRDYQVDAANRLLEAKRGIAKMATNSGKTEVFAAIVQAYNTPNTIVVVTRKELMYQTAERLSRRLGMEIGMFGDSKRVEGIVSVCMIQTLAAMESHELQAWFGNNQLVILDECHHGSAEKMIETLNKIPGYHRFGFSGTPLKDKVLPDLKLIAATGEVIVEVTNEEMIGLGHSAKPIIYVHNVSSEVDGEFNYHQAYETFIVTNEDRNSLVAKLASESYSIALIVVERIDHGNILKDMIPYSQFLNGSDSMEDRLQAIENMRAGVNGVYIATSIFDEGIDVPNIDTLILAAGGKSVIRLLQRIGRGLRKKEGENILTVHDFYDDTNDYLESHSVQRMKIYEQEGFEVIRL